MRGHNRPAGPFTIGLSVLGRRIRCTSLTVTDRTLQTLPPCLALHRLLLLLLPAPQQLLMQQPAGQECRGSSAAACWRCRCSRPRMTLLTSPSPAGRAAWADPALLIQAQTGGDRQSVAAPECPTATTSGRKRLQASTEAFSKRPSPYLRAFSSSKWVVAIEPARSARAFSKAVARAVPSPGSVPAHLIEKHQRRGGPLLQRVQDATDPLHMTAEGGELCCKDCSSLMSASTGAHHGSTVDEQGRSMLI